MGSHMIQRADEIGLKRDRIIRRAKIESLGVLVRHGFQINRALKKLVGRHVVFDVET